MAREFKERLSKCCADKVIFNHATGDYVCRLCRDRVASVSVNIETKPRTTTATERLLGCTKG